MQDNSSQFYVGLDIGTTQIRCVVGSMNILSDEPNLSVVGSSAVANSGMKKGLVTHMEEVSSAIAQAVVEAERMSGIHIGTATVNVNGSNVAGMDSRGVVAISASSKEIAPEDKFRAEEAATIVQLPSNREIIQVFPKNYQVDGHDSIKDPVGMQGVRLEVETHIITASTPNLRNLDRVLEKANIQPNNYTVNGLAAAEIVLTRQQKEAGCAVIDIGAATTNLAVLEDGEIQHVAVIPIGGVNITNDLAIGLKVDLDIAEQIKLKHGGLASNIKQGSVSITQDKRNHVFEADDVNMIIEARVEEIFDYVDKELSRIKRSQKLPGGIVLVGGTAKMPGLAEYAKEKLGLSVKTGSLKAIEGITDKVGDLTFLSAVGLMNLDMLFTGNSGGGGSTKSKLDQTSSVVKSLWQKIKP